MGEYPVQEVSQPWKYSRRHSTVSYTGIQNPFNILLPVIDSITVCLETVSTKTILEFRSFVVELQQVL